MEKLLVYVDFDWLNEPQQIGILSYERLRGSDTYGFTYNKEWLKNHGGIQLSDDINNYPGSQYTPQGHDIFGCFADALPDRWGRLLLNRREQIQAEEEKRSIKKLSSFDYLVGIDDFSRMGAFRFKINQDDDFINQSSALQIPPLTNLRKLLHASMEIEIREEKNELPDKKWVLQLIQPGTSLGGARPKASIIGEDNKLFIAKFPSRNDTYDVGLWEHFCHLLAKESGIHTAVTHVVSSGEKYHVLLSLRFDRNDIGRRVHFASAMSMLGLKDGDNFSSGNGYLDIVDFIVQGCTDVENNLEELYRRVAFNICVGNTDDHFRNHGFLLTAKGWILSPAYDMNPTLSEYQSLLISSKSNSSDLNILLDACEEYMIDKSTADNIICEVVKAVGDWKIVANRLQISQSEMNLFGARLNKYAAWKGVTKGCK